MDSFGARGDAMWSVLRILLWPVVVACRLGLEVLIWFRPSIAQGRRAFPESIRRLIDRADTTVFRRITFLAADPVGEHGRSTEEAIVYAKRADHHRASLGYLLGRLCRWHRLSRGEHGALP